MDINKLNNNKYSKYSFQVDKISIIKKDKKYIPIILVKNFMRENELIAENIIIPYTKAILQLNELKTEDKITLEAKSQKWYINSENEYNLEIGISLIKIKNCDLKKFNKIKRNNTPKQTNIMLGKIMFDNKKDFFDDDEYESIVNKYLEWKKDNNVNNNHNKKTRVELNKRYNFKGKFRNIYITKLRNGNYSIKINFIGLRLDNNIYLNGKTQLSYTQGFKNIGELKKWEMVSFDATVKEINTFKKGKIKNKYKLSYPKNIKTLKNRTRKPIPKYNKEIVNKVYKHKLYNQKGSSSFH